VAWNASGAFQPWIGLREKDMFIFLSGGKIVLWNANGANMQWIGLLIKDMFRY